MNERGYKNEAVKLCERILNMLLTEAKLDSLHNTYVIPIGTVNHIFDILKKMDNADV